MSDPAQAGALLREIREVGVRIAIDDFGTGYSSLACLMQLSIHAVKVDRGFMAQIPELVEKHTILHGSIAVNGVSLTVNAFPVKGQCQVGIIPFTWEHTNLGALKPGDPLNLEGDLIGKYVAKLLSAWKGGEGINLTGLEAWGYGGEKE